MARRSSKYPTELELEILKILWSDGESSVRHVRKELTNFRRLAHTSVMTMMAIMTEKGYLKRFKRGKSYTYKPCVTKEETRSGILGDVVDRVFNGSTMAAMVNLIETRDIDEAELAELHGLLKQKVKEKQK